MARKPSGVPLRDQVRDRLRSIAEQAVTAQRISVRSDNLCDLLDDIDNELQRVIALVDKIRRGEFDGGGR